MRIAAHSQTSPSATPRASTGLNAADLDWTKDRVQLRSDIESTDKALGLASFDAYRYGLQAKIAGGTHAATLLASAALDSLGLVNLGPHTVGSAVVGCLAGISGGVALYGFGKYLDASSRESQLTGALVRLQSVERQRFPG